MPRWSGGSSSGRLCSRHRLTRTQKWIAAFGLLIFGLGGVNLVRAWLALRFARALPDLPLTMPLQLLATTSIVWGVVFIACAVGLWRLRAWGRWGTLVAYSLYQAHVWANHLLLDASDRARQVWPWDAAVSAVTLMAVWGFLNWPGVRQALGRWRETSTE